MQDYNYADEIVKDDYYQTNSYRFGSYYPKEEILNDQDQYQPVNEQDNEEASVNATATAEDKKKGFEEGIKNDNAGTIESDRKN